jgi:hypothetical protein
MIVGEVCPAPTALPLLPQRAPGTTPLPGLQQLTEQDIAAMSEEEATQAIDDLRHVKLIQRRLPGVKLLDREELASEPHEQRVQHLLDIRDALSRLDMTG